MTEVIKKMKLGIVIVGIHTVPFWYFKNFVELFDKLKKDFEVNVAMVQGVYPDFSKNKALTYILSNPPDKVIFMEEDHSFTYEDFVKLVNYDVDIVSAVYCLKAEPYNPVAFIEPKVRLAKYTKTVLTKIYCGGLGLTVVKPKVFEKVEFPWFGHSFEHGETDDMYFAKKAKEAGVDWFLANEIEISHMNVAPKLWNLYKEEILKDFDLVDYGNGLIGIKW
jgi:hypothetical protein